MPQVPDVVLNDGNKMPRMGMGFWRVDDRDVPRVLRDAVAAGYRSLDTAAFYGNEAGLGQGVAVAGVEREELFITSKLWNDDHGYDKALHAFDNGMERLGLEYIDLYLIHWPVPSRDKYVDTWKALIKLREEGRVRSIGVSNFLEHHLKRLIDATGVVPAVNQMEYHPYFKRPELLGFCRDAGIVSEAWAPLGRGEAMDEPAIVSLAGKYGKTPAQIILRWLLDNGLSVIPKTVTPARMRENIAVFDFHLEESEVATLNALQNSNRIGGDPDTFTGPAPAAAPSEG